MHNCCNYPVIITITINVKQHSCTMKKHNNQLGNVNFVTRKKLKRSELLTYYIIKD